MSASITSRPTLAETAWHGGNATVRNVTLAVLGSLALWLSAKIQVPFYPVSMTMQTFVVLAVGMAFGWRLGATTVLLYLVEGAAGLPVFAGTPEKGIGLAYMAGPTGGYLVGFVLAAAAVGALAQRGLGPLDPDGARRDVDRQCHHLHSGIAVARNRCRLGQAGAGVGHDAVPAGRRDQGGAGGLPAAPGLAFHPLQAISESTD